MTVSYLDLNLPSLGEATRDDMTLCPYLCLYLRFVSAPKTVSIWPQQVIHHLNSAHSLTCSIRACLTGP